MTKIVAGDRFNGQLVREGRATFRGSYRRADGKFETKIWRTDDFGDASSKWEAWKHKLAADEHKKNRVGVHVPVAQKAQKLMDDKQKPQLKEESMATPKTESKPIYYVLQVVGGPALYWFDDEDKAVDVCSALEAAAKASGFSAQYDVAEVKRWEV